MNQSDSKSLSILDLYAMKQRGEKIACLTAYDAAFSAVIDAAGIDLILVGDSLGMVVQGHNTTLPVTMADMIYHSQCVNRGRKRAFLVADLPFMAYSNPQIAAHNAAQLMQNCGVQMVKLEGARLECIRFLTEQGIPVCGHLGLQPQSIHQMGSYAVQGKDPQTADKIREDAHRLAVIGIDMLVLECVPAMLAATIASELTIPVIGIGAGISCDGQILVLYDMLNIGIGKRPKFSKNFMGSNSDIFTAIKSYQQAVKSRHFPELEHSF